MRDLSTDWANTLLTASMPWMLIGERVPWFYILIQILVALLATGVAHSIGTRVLMRLAMPS